jgi:4-diphosphocytidyl-2-C-methyl-D-erythritol kinase
MVGILQEIAYAKINLALHVRGREPDGYHRIETIFAFCEHGDVLSYSEASWLSVTVIGPFAGDLANEPANSVELTARSLFLTGAFVLDKKLPVASGLGGGSADAAATLRLAGRIQGMTQDEMMSAAPGLGADGPACLLSRTARGDGRGDLVAPLDIPGLAGTPVLLVNPGVPVRTPSVFADWDGVDMGPLDDWESGGNDLEAPARRLAPVIGEVLDALAGARTARMSGSGATCFGLYADKADRDAAAARIAAAHPGWWLLKSRLR